jgi:hypothetical protein
VTCGAERERVVSTPKGTVQWHHSAEGLCSGGDDLL